MFAVPGLGILTLQIPELLNFSILQISRSLINEISGYETVVPAVRLHQYRPRLTILLMLACLSATRTILFEVS